MTVQFITHYSYLKGWGQRENNLYAGADYEPSTS